MLITGVTAAAFGTNCWVLAAGEGEDCLIVDPGIGVVDGVQQVLRAHRLRPVAILLTHGHVDHVWSVVPVCRTASPPPAVYIHADDAYRLADPTATLDPRLVAMLAAEFPTEATWAAPTDVTRIEGPIGRIEAASLSIGVRHTPGHTEGSVVFELPGEPDGAPGAGAEGRPPQIVLSGDLLFAGSIGRSDLAGGDEVAMSVSLRAVMAAYPDSVAVLPGHGERTTIGRERATNPFIRAVLAAPGPATTPGVAP